MIPVPTAIVLALLRGNLAPELRAALELAALDAAAASAPAEPIPHSPDGRETVADAAESAGIPRYRIYNWISRGCLDYVLRDHPDGFGKVRAVRLAEVIRLRDAAVKVPESEIPIKAAARASGLNSTCIYDWVNMRLVPHRWIMSSGQYPREIVGVLLGDVLRVKSERLAKRASK